jgi:hypothetical protein
VPPKQFFAKEFRDAANLNLFWLPTHKDCNGSFQKDEDYFVASMAPESIGSFTGDRLWGDVVRRLGRPDRPQDTKLVERIRDEYTDRVGGVYLPPGYVAKNSDWRRLYRIAWKVLRGLFTAETGRFLPDFTPRVTNFYPQGTHPPESLRPILAAAPLRGRHVGVLAYKQVAVESLDFHFWGVLFWDRLLWTIGFHDPDCTCPKCDAERSLPTPREARDPFVVEDVHAPLA